MDQQTRGNQSRKGESHHRAKLTDETVREIRASKEPSTVLADRYGVTRECVSRVRRRKTWAHVA